MKQRIVIFHAHLPERVELALDIASQGHRVLMHASEPIPGASELAQNVNVQIRYGSRLNMCQLANRVHL